MSHLISSKDYYANRFPWITVDNVELDPTMVNTVFERHGKQYLSSFVTSKHSVPAVIPYVTIQEKKDFANENAERITMYTYILEPKKWIITKVNVLDKEGGDDRAPKKTVTSDDEVSLNIEAGIEMTASLGASGTYGPVSYSAELKTHVGAEYKKTAKAKVLQESTIDLSDAYQRCYYRAQLVCDVKAAYQTSFSMFAGGWAVVTTDDGKKAVDGDRLIYKLSDDFPRGKVDGIQADFGKTIEFSDNVKNWENDNYFNKRRTGLKVVPGWDGTPLVTYDVHREEWSRDGFNNQSLLWSGWEKTCSGYSVMQKTKVEIKENRCVIDFNTGMPNGPDIWYTAVKL